MGPVDFFRFWGRLDVMFCMRWRRSEKRKRELDCFEELCFVRRATDGGKATHGSGATCGIVATVGSAASAWTILA